MEQANNQERTEELGRVIARQTKALEADRQKNMIKAEKRKQTMLENAAERALSGKLSR